MFDKISTGKMLPKIQNSGQHNYLQLRGKSSGVFNVYFAVFVCARLSHVFDLSLNAVSGNNMFALSRLFRWRS